MKTILLKAGVVVLVFIAAGSAYRYRDAYLGYLPGASQTGVTSEAPQPRLPVGTRQDPFVGRGVIAEIRHDPPQLVLEHGAIPGFMDGMTMGYPVAGDVSLDSLATGDTVEFRIETLGAEGPGNPTHEIFAVAASDSPAAAAETAPNTGMFTVDLGRQQLIGVRTAPVTYQTLDRTVRTIGTVALDETRVSEVYSRVAGWIEETFVDFQYQPVSQGDPLFTIYSPELLATQEEYLLALRGLETLGQSSFPSVAFGAEDLVRAARRRLELWNVTAEQIAQLEETREPFRAMTIYSPVTGNVIVRNAFAAQRVTPETMLYQIADHSVVWVKVDIYENDMASVSLGQRAVLQVPSLPGRDFSGRLTFIDPHVNAETRTLTVRLEFANPNHTLKPGMYADVELRAPMGRRLMVPAAAVLRTGLRNVVFVDHGNGRMEIREVRLGTRAGDHYELLAGLEEGERVVTSGNFLIDAESQLQAAEPVGDAVAVP